MSIILRSTILLTFWIMILTACGGQANNNSIESDSGNKNSNQPLKVVATTGQVGDAVKNIGADKIDLTIMFGPGVDPHLYVPTEGDVTLLSEADVVFYNGLHLEAQMSRVLNQMAIRGVQVVALGEVLPADKLLQWDTDYPHDPHIWNEPLLWSMGVEAVRDTLITADPTNETTYRDNATAYLAEVAETHAYIEEQTARIPEERRIMVTAHDAFGYFARTYGFEVYGLQGISTESEASTADVQNLAQFIVDKEIPAIFVESTVSPRNIEAVQAAVQAKGFAVEIGGQLYSDALGDPGTTAGTYNGMLRHNIDTLVTALSE